MLNKYIISLLSFSLLFCQGIIIHGIVIDKDSKNPLFGANVFITGDDKYSQGASTDEDGNYIITISKSGLYELNATYIGYDDFVESILIKPGDKKTQMDISLFISSLQLQQYVVTASRGRREKITDAPAAISIISARKIRSASNPNLGDYFKNIKGVDFTASD